MERFDWRATLAIPEPNLLRECILADSAGVESVSV